MDRVVAYLSQAKYHFTDGTEVFIGGLDFKVLSGQKVVILGPNGSGKTTLLLLLMGLLKAESGIIKLFGLDPQRHFDQIKQKIGVVFQNVEAQLIAPTVKEDISFTPRNYGLSDDEIERRVRKISVLIGIEHISNKIIHYLSGGEKKKVAIAGAMAMEPPLLILDEPFEGLDPRAKRELTSILELFNDLYGTTVILSTHDVDAAGRFADWLYVMTSGNLVLEGQPVDIFKKLAELKRANLQAPGILELTYEMRKRGLDVSPTLDLEEAVNQLIALIRNQ